MSVIIFLEHISDNSVFVNNYFVSKIHYKMHVNYVSRLYYVSDLVSFRTQFKFDKKFNKHYVKFIRDNIKSRNGCSEHRYPENYYVSGVLGAHFAF